MALGRHRINNVSLDSSTDPDDTTLLAAQGTHQRGYVLGLTVSVTTEQASSQIHIEDGAGGERLATVDSSSAGATNFGTDTWGPEGYRMSKNTALNATVEGATGVVATVSGTVDVKGSGA